MKFHFHVPVSKNLGPGSTHVSDGEARFELAATPGKIGAFLLIHLYSKFNSPIAELDEFLKSHPRLLLNNLDCTVCELSDLLVVMPLGEWVS